MGQYRVRVKDLTNNQTHTLSVLADTTRGARIEAVKQSKYLLGVDQLEVTGIILK